jgi:hypothetical protein
MQTQSSPNPTGDQVATDRALRSILRDNIARLLYDSDHLGQGLPVEDVDPSIMAAYNADARAAQRLTDPIVRAVLPELVAQAFAIDRGWDWPELKAVAASVDPSWDAVTAYRHIQLNRVETRQRLRHMARIAVKEVLTHLREGGSDRHPHQEAELVEESSRQVVEDESKRRELLKLRVIEGGRDV